mmetsp:Transcript_18970/g.54067  ORF Transcript_18970/g.54067 Transcript_18970/m.54067 type:complete len:448 (-) Transcript_18970:791-2134(-)
MAGLPPRVLMPARALPALSADGTVQIQDHAEAFALDEIHGPVEVAEAGAHVGLPGARTGDAPSPDGKSHVGEAPGPDLLEIPFGEVRAPVVVQQTLGLARAEGLATTPLASRGLGRGRQVVPQRAAWARLEDEPTAKVDATPTRVATEGPLEVALGAHEHRPRLPREALGFVGHVPRHVPDQPVEVGMQALGKDTALLLGREEREKLVLVHALVLLAPDGALDPCAKAPRLFRVPLEHGVLRGVPCREEQLAQRFRGKLRQLLERLLPPDPLLEVVGRLRVASMPDVHPMPSRVPTSPPQHRREGVGDNVNGLALRLGVAQLRTEEGVAPRDVAADRGDLHQHLRGGLDPPPIQRAQFRQVQEEHEHPAWITQPLRECVSEDIRASSVVAPLAAFAGRNRPRAALLLPMRTVHRCVQPHEKLSGGLAATSRVQRMVVSGNQGRENAP